MMCRIFQKIIATLSTMLILSGCTQPIESPDALHNPLPYQEQTLQQLHLSISPQTDAQDAVIAAWIPYFAYDVLLSNPDNAVNRQRIRAWLEQAKDLGINTIFAHTVAFGEAYHTSSHYPKTGDDDVLALLSELCAECELSLHAWINPLRLQTDAVMPQHTGDTTLGRWFLDAEQRLETMCRVNDRWYLNPASESVCDFLCDAAEELLTQYDIDGIHIDDYFYPTTDPAFDAAGFAESGETDLAAWRKQNIHRMMQRLYQRIHAVKPDAVFSVSPQGNLTVSTEHLYADAAYWLAHTGYADWVIPQIYFGFENESSPFAETVAAWQALPRADTVRLLIGIATYKVNSSDPYAGIGSAEWQTDTEIPARQAALVLQDPSIEGIALYHLDTTLQMPESERTALKDILRSLN